MSNYAPDAGGDYAYRYPGNPAGDGFGSLQPVNLNQQPPPYRRGKIGASDGSYYQCANLLWRVLAGLIDYPVVFVLVAIALAIGDAINGLAGVTCPDQYGTGCFGFDDGLAWTVIVGIVGFNNVFLQGMTGQSIGKKVLGMQLVRGVKSADGQEMLVRPGVFVALVRQLLHVVDAAPFYLGFLAPLWTERYQTFSDMMCNTAVLREPDGVVGLPFAPPGSKGAKI